MNKAWPGIRVGVGTRVGVGVCVGAGVAVGTVVGCLQADQFGGLGSGQLFGLTTAINANDIGNLGGEILEQLVQGSESGDLSALDNDRAGEIFALVGDDIIGGFDGDHVAAALDALGADFFGAGATGFEGIAGGDTVFDLIDFEAPEALADLLTGEEFENLFANSFTTNSTGGL